MNDTSYIGAHKRYLQDLAAAEQSRERILKIPTRSFFRAQEKAIAVMNDLIDVNPDQAEKSFDAIIQKPLKAYREALIEADNRFNELVHKAREKYSKLSNTIDRDDI